jgi:hypothetical protein
MNWATFRGEFVKVFLAPLVVAISVPVGTYYLGKAKGEAGKMRGFDQIPTQLKLDNTRWKITYEDADERKTGLVVFEQHGSRIVGDGSDTTGRKWIIEGATAERRVCYIYYDPTGSQLSFGTVILVMDNSGNTMTGQWLGWSPESDMLQPRKVTATKITN